MFRRFLDWLLDREVVTQWEDRCGEDRVLRRWKRVVTFRNGKPQYPIPNWEPTDEVIGKCNPERWW